jgi:hypothetical protein
MPIGNQWFPNELPPRQKLVYETARRLISEGKEVSPREIAKDTEGQAIPNAAEIRRVESVITILKKKKCWNFPPANGGRPKIKTIILDESRTLKTTTPPPNDPIPFDESSFCNLHPSEEDAVHDFGIKVLEEFGKLSRGFQVKLWAIVSELVAHTMKGQQ